MWGKNQGGFKEETTKIQGGFREDSTSTRIKEGFALFVFCWSPGVSAVIPLWLVPTVFYYSLIARWRSSGVRRTEVRPRLVFTITRGRYPGGNPEGSPKVPWGAPKRTPRREPGVHPGRPPNDSPRGPPGDTPGVTLEGGLGVCLVPCFGDKFWDHLKMI